MGSLLMMTVMMMMLARKSARTNVRCRLLGLQDTNSIADGYQYEQMHLAWPMKDVADALSIAKRAQHNNRPPHFGFGFRITTTPSSRSCHPTPLPTNSSHPESADLSTNTLSALK